MSGFADVREICRNCHCPIEPNEATRTYGDHRAHMENRCLELLHAEIERLRAENADLRRDILNFPNLTAMREAMIATADENAELRATLAEWGIGGPPPITI